MLAALRAVAVETQSLVGHELPAARVDGGTDGDTGMMALAWVKKSRDGRKPRKTRAYIARDGADE